MNKLKRGLKIFTLNFWETKREANPDNFFYKAMAILIASLQSFFADNCFDKASTLTFYSLLTIVPLVAISFGIAKELGFENKFRHEIIIQFNSQPMVADKLIEFSDATLRQTKEGFIAGCGIVILLWTVFCMIGNIAFYFNQIWRIKVSRTLWQQCKSFIPMILLFPIFLVASSSFVAYTSTIALKATESILFLKAFNPFFTFLFKYLPLTLNWLLLIFLYIYLPNTKVNWKAGAIAGTIAGVLCQAWQWIYIAFQFNATSYGAIYGVFAAVPLFLIWLNYSWLIILFGTELAYHIQKLNESEHLSEQIQENNYVALQSDS
jgi:membrane protein